MYIEKKFQSDEVNVPNYSSSIALKQPSTIYNEFHYFIVIMNCFIVNFNYFIMTFKYFIVSLSYFIMTFNYFIMTFNYLIVNLNYFIVNFNYFPSHFPSLLFTTHSCLPCLSLK